VTGKRAGCARPGTTTSCARRGRWLRPTGKLVANKTGVVEDVAKQIQMPPEQLDAYDGSSPSIRYRRRQLPVYEREPFQQPSPVGDNPSADS
jgi:hypothetical protein